MEPIEGRVLQLENTISLLLEHIQEVKTSIAHGFEKVEGNFEKVNEKIDALRGNSTSNLEKVEIKLDDLKTEISKINDITGYEGMFNNSKTLKIVKEG